MTKEIKERPQPVPKTVRVKTLIIGAIWLSTIVASLIGGWTVHAQDTTRVNQEASALVSQLKVDAK